MKRLRSIGYRRVAFDPHFTIHSMPYLNFNLTTTPQRFHVLFPYSNPDAVNFTAWDNHLKMLLTEADYNDTRKLKLTDPDPEPDSMEFHAWRRQQQNASAMPPLDNQR